MDNDVVLLELQSLKALRHNYPLLQQLCGCISFLVGADFVNADRYRLALNRS